MKLTRRFFVLFEELSWESADKEAFAIVQPQTNIGRGKPVLEADLNLCHAEFTVRNHTLDYVAR